MGVDIISVFNPKEEIDYNPTKADRIRSMEDEELAKFITKQFCHGIGENLILEWLQKPEERDWK